MRNNISFAKAGIARLLTAALTLAIAFTFSCSSDDGGGSSSSATGGGGCSSLTGNSGTITDSRDNKPYKWVRIGEQCWLAENMNYDVPGNTTDVCHRNEPAKCVTYGRLYNFATAKIVCPSGWRLPNDTDWTTLIDFVGSATAGTKLKSVSGWDDDNNGGNGNGTDDHGFKALPGTYGWLEDGNVSFERDVGRGGYWWRVINADRAENVSMSNTSESVLKDDGNMLKALWSVRCVKD